MSSMMPNSVSPYNESRGVADAVDEDENGEEKSAEVDDVNEKDVQEESGCADVQCDPVGSDGEEDHGDVDEDEEEDHAQPAGLRDPGLPSAAERAEHCLTHIPYRSWCRHCVRGKAKGRQSRRIRGDAAHSECPRVRFDYCMIADRTQEEDASEGDEEGAGDEEGGKSGEHEESKDKEGGEEGERSPSATILVMQESHSRSVWAYNVATKGASESWVVEQIVEDLYTVGLKNDRIVVKSDQEASAQELSRAVAHARESDYGTAIEASAVGESDTNASIERAIQDVEAQIRTLRSALEERIGARVHIKSRVVDWLIRHAACFISRCRVRPDGRTAMQKIKGRNPISKIAEFGEVVHFKIPKTQLTPGKFEDWWSDGLWLGFEMRTAEHLIGTNVGVFRVSSVMRKPEDERWSAARVRDLVGSPSQPVPGQMGRRMPAYSRRHHATAPTDDSTNPQERGDQQSTRNWKVYRQEVLDNGGTPGCPGCRAIIRGIGTRAGHTQRCRDRLEAILMATPEGRARIERARERQRVASSDLQPQQAGGGEVSPPIPAATPGPAPASPRTAEEEAARGVWAHVPGPTRVVPGPPRATTSDQGAQTSTSAGPIPRQTTAAGAMPTPTGAPTTMGPDAPPPGMNRTATRVDPATSQGLQNRAAQMRRASVARASASAAGSSLPPPAPAVGVPTPVQPPTTGGASSSSGQGHAAPPPAAAGSATGNPGSSSAATGATPAKRRADAPPDDPRTQQTDQAQVITGQGLKRSAPNPPDDPRTQNTDTPDVSSVETYRKRLCDLR